MKLLVDSDVLLDIALDRQPFFERSNAALEWCQRRPQSAIFAWHTMANLYYLLRAGRSDIVARDFIADLLQFGLVARGGTYAVKRALTLPLADFEDSLQVAAGLSEEAQFIVTRNLADYRKSPLPAITPQEFLRRMHVS